MDKIFDDFVKNKIKVMEGIDFKANQEKIKKIDSIRKYYKKQKRKQIIICSLIFISLFLIIILF